MNKPCFLGLELTDQLRACVVDEQLEVINVTCVDFDTEVPEFMTHGGIFTTPGDAYTTPVEMWIKALDILLVKLSQNFDLSRIKCIGGCAQHACVWWKGSMPAPLLRFNDSQKTLHEHIFSGGNPFSMPNTPVAQDTSALQQALELERQLGGADATASRLGTPAHASLTAAQAMKVREEQPEVWRRTGRITLASTLLCSLLAGQWVPTAESEACAMGMWSHALHAWDEEVLEIVAGSSAFEHAGRLRMMLGEVDTSSGGRRVGNISTYFVERFGFPSDCFLVPFTSDYLATYLSLCPTPTDAVISFGPMDFMLTSAPHYVPNRLYTLLPHPAQDANEKRRYVALLMSRNGDVPRALVRDMYTKSWSAFDRLVAIVPPGGSIGLDNKLFSFWHLQAEAFPFSHVKGIYRFETGIKVNEFRDLRGNPRCLLESQLLSFRVRYARMRLSNLFYNANRPVQQGNFGSPSSSLGLNFDPYSTTSLPRRIIATGAAANFPSVVNLVGDIFNAPIYVPSTQLDSAHSTPPGAKTQYGNAHRNAPAPGFASRATLGGAYVARWVWGRERALQAGSAVAFEDEIKRLLTRRWNSQRNRAGGGSGPGTPSPAPYMQRSSGLGTSVLVEEEEEEEGEGEEGEEDNGMVGDLMSNSVSFRSHTGNGPSLVGTKGLLGSNTTPPPTRIRSLGSLNMTPSSVTTSHLLSPNSTTPGGSSSGITSMTSPDVNAFVSGVNGVSPTVSVSPITGGDSSATTARVTPLTPVSAMPTADAEAQLGWMKVADSDVDAFMAYASVVPEFVRLESVLIKSLA